MSFYLMTNICFGTYIFLEKQELETKYLLFRIKFQHAWQDVYGGMEGDKGDGFTVEAPPGKKVMITNLSTSSGSLAS